MRILTDTRQEREKKKIPGNDDGSRRTPHGRRWGLTARRKGIEREKKRRGEEERERRGKELQDGLRGKTTSNQSISPRGVGRRHGAVLILVKRERVLFRQW